MLKPLLKEMIIPLPEANFTILGIYIKTSPVPQYTFGENLLSVKDQWLIQIVSAQNRNLTAQKEPVLTEYKTTWQEEFHWDKEKSSALTIRYHKKPRSIKNFVQNNPAQTHPVNPPSLHLTIETCLEIDFSEDPLQRRTQRQVPLQKQQHNTKPITEMNTDINTDMNTDINTDMNTETNSISTEICNAKTNSTIINHEQTKLPTEKKTVSAESVGTQTEPLKGNTEEKVARLTELLKQFAVRLDTLEKEMVLYTNKKSRLNGVIVDAFRLIPIPRAIVEIYPPGGEELLLKTVSNNRGFYCLDLSPGQYDLKIKHSHFSPLLIKDYSIKDSEEKLQDFMLHQI